MSQRPRRMALVGLGILATLVLIALAAPLLAPYDPAARSGRPFSAPSRAHLLGTNDVGHDLLSELIFGTRVSLLVGIIAALAATIIGSAVGVTAGYARGWVDTTLMRVVDVVLALPALPLTIVIGVFAGPGLMTQIVVIVSVIWAGVARELRSQVLSLRERDHIQAARAMGAGPSHVVLRHLLPAVTPLLVPQFVLAAKTAIMLEASLAFLGLGDLAAKSWGTMLSLAHSRSAFLTDAWRWWVVPPGLAIALTVVAFAMVGYAFEERARPSLRSGNPSSRRRRAGRTPARPAVAAVGDAPFDTPPLVIDDLSVAYRVGDTLRPAVERMHLEVAAGELLGLVGESGGGKSTVAAAAIGLLPAAAVITGGTVRVEGRDLAILSARELRRMRGDQVALIPQEAMSALNPVHTIAAQLVEAVRAHQSVSRADARRRAAELLDMVGIEPGLGRDFPHQLSGGMRQRVVIAMALANDPRVVIADEPTAGLDVLAQAAVLALLDGLRHRLGLALVIVSHDLPMIEQVADRVAVLQAGRLVEVGPTAQVIGAPEHPYTRTLVESAPRLLVAPAAVAR